MRENNEKDNSIFIFGINWKYLYSKNISRKELQQNQPQCLVQNLDIICSGVIVTGNFMFFCCLTIGGVQELHNHPDTQP